MQIALARYLDARARGADHRQGVRAAAEAVAGDPWRVVREAGALARARPHRAEADLGLTAELRPVAPDDARAVARIEAGQPHPTLDLPGRRSQGAFDTPTDLAREVARATVTTARRARRGLDPACGAGAFLVAMAEAGVPDLVGTDLDPVVVEVARVACPRARVSVADALEPGELADVVCGNPPFVRPERQDKGLRAELRRRLPWLRGRFDMVVPLAALAAERVEPGGALGLVLPFATLVQPYASSLRRRWLRRYRLRRLEGPRPFGGAAVKVGWIVVEVGPGPAADRWPVDAALRLPDAPLSPTLAPGDVEIVERMTACSETLGMFCEIDTGLVAHGRSGGKARLLTDRPEAGTVPYADARDFFSGDRRFLRYRPDEMHRPKRPQLFEDPKLVIQRLRGRSPVRAAVDRDGIYVGHTCTVARPWGPGLDLDALVELVRSPLVDGFTRIRCGARLDLYPRDVRAIPVPLRWLVNPDVDLACAYGLDARAVDRLADIVTR
ncbi:MAG: hypothetical protein AAF602_23985 [Myxococcota bacterium]